MDFAYYKYLFYINKMGTVSTKNIQDKFKLSHDEAYNVMNTIYLNEYIKPSKYKNEYFSPTFKCKNFVKSFLTKWLINNFLAVIAIIISLIALFQQN